MPDETKGDATILGIIYHPEIRERLTESGKNDISKMIRELVIEIYAESNKRFANGFVKGQLSVQRRNKSGCCCIIDDNDKVVSACGAHLNWLDEELKGQACFVCGSIGSEYRSKYKYSLCQGCWEALERMENCRKRIESKAKTLYHKEAIR